MKESVLKRTELKNLQMGDLFRVDCKDYDKGEYNVVVCEELLQLPRVKLLFSDKTIMDFRNEEIVSVFGSMKVNENIIENYKSKYKESKML